MSNLDNEREMWDAIVAQENRSQPLGVIGQHITVEGEVMQIKPVASRYGMCVLIKMVTDAGNHVATFTNDKQLCTLLVGDRVKWGGDVKKHDLFRGVKQTVLTRVKVVK